MFEYIWYHFKIKLQSFIVNSKHNDKANSVTVLIALAPLRARPPLRARHPCINTGGARTEWAHMGRVQSAPLLT